VLLPPFANILNNHLLFILLSNRTLNCISQEGSIDIYKMFGSSITIHFKISIIANRSPSLAIFSKNISSEKNQGLRLERLRK
jgi:hypothetical protein